MYNMQGSSNTLNIVNILSCEKKVPNSRHTIQPFGEKERKRMQETGQVWLPFLLSPSPQHLALAEGISLSAFLSG